MSYDSSTSRGGHRSASIESTGSLAIRDQLAAFAGRPPSLPGIGLRSSMWSQGTGLFGHVKNACALYIDAAVNGSPFSFADQRLERRFLDQKYKGISVATRYILLIELVIHAILIHDIYRTARGRPTLEVNLCLLSGVAAMWWALYHLWRNPGAFRKWRIGINSFLRVWLTLVYTQTRYLFPYLLYEQKKMASSKHMFIDRVFIRSFAAVVAVVGNLPVPLGPHVTTHVIMILILANWDGWYCSHILQLPDVATQLGAMGEALAPKLEYLMLLPLGVPALAHNFLSIRPDGPIPCANHLALLQVWASIGGTVGKLLLDWLSRRTFLAAHTAAVQALGTEQSPDDMYCLYISEMRVSGERLVQVLLMVACGYSVFWVFCLMRIAGTDPPFWAKRVLPLVCDQLCSEG
eukprot:jgi/Botrbrau1/2472/Bobra.0226s0030.1